jgi:hypothetical protein
VFRKPELCVALILTALILVFHILRATCAGGLWRDEAATANLARNFSLSAAINNSQHELFPALLPAVLHGYNGVAGASDTALRVFGAAVGILIIAALWWTTWTIGKTVPLLSLALLGFNTMFIQWGDTVRGYGLGSLFIILAVGSIWCVVDRATPWNILVAALITVAAVQSLFHTSVLILGLCWGGVAVALSKGLGKEQKASPRRSPLDSVATGRRTALIILAIGVVAAISLVPYWEPLSHVPDWNMLVRQPVGLSELLGPLWRVLSSSGWWNGLVWVLLFVVCLGFSVLAQLPRLEPHTQGEKRNVSLFSAVALLVGFLGSLAFLKSTGTLLQPWYFLALTALSALLFDLLLSSSKVDADSSRFDVRSLRTFSGLRVPLALLVAASSILPTLRGIYTRQTNIDLAAASLTRLSTTGDLVIVEPWYLGVSFERYYHGVAPWETVPAIADHKVHRYDLLKAVMLQPDQDAVVAPVRDRIRDVLKSGHKVWLVGDFITPKPGTLVPTLPPVPNDSPQPWYCDPYYRMWAAKLGSCLSVWSTRIEPIPLEERAPVNPVEDFPLTVFGGWSGL